MPAESPLGKPTTYAGSYDRELLYAMSRAESRDALGLGAELPFRGCDFWTAWELSWLDAEGVPQTAIADIQVPADSPNIIKSPTNRQTTITETLPGWGVFRGRQSVEPVKQ